jgi:transcriptional accessory protein Tex/SPT6
MCRIHEKQGEKILWIYRVHPETYQAVEKLLQNLVSYFEISKEGTKRLVEND